MASFEEVAALYDAQAAGYNDITDLPVNVLETQLLGAALGDLKGKHVMDLGGGCGLHARQAADAGAASVDVIDISAGMLRVGEETEKKLGHVGRIRWFQADSTKPLTHLPLRQYDIVMSNFMFDHATNREELEGMWRNVAAYLKPGGRFVGARVGNPWSEGVCSGKYGVTYKDHQDIPGGLRYRYKLHLKEPIEFEASSLETSYSGSTEVIEKVGLVDIENEPFESAQVVRDDPDFWKAYTEDPGMQIVKALKPLVAAC